MNEPMAKKFDEELIERAIRYKQSAQKPISDESFGTACGFSGTTIYRWLTKKYTGDVTEVESRVRDVLESAEVREADRPRPVKTTISRLVRGYFERIRKARQIAVVSGEAGIGKTISCELYRKEFATTMLATISNWGTDERALMRLIYQAGRLANWPRAGSLGAYVAKMLKGSDRLVVIDNAHKLTNRGLGALFDLTDASKIPIALVANPEIVERISSNDQWHSRVGPHKILQISEDDIRLVADRLAEFYALGSAPKIKKLAESTMRSKGHGRRLENRLQMAKQIFDEEDGSDWMQAFEDAGREMIQIEHE